MVVDLASKFLTLKNVVGGRQSTCAILHFSFLTSCLAKHLLTLNKAIFYVVFYLPNLAKDIGGRTVYSFLNSALIVNGNIEVPVIVRKCPGVFLLSQT